MTIMCERKHLRITAQELAQWLENSADAVVIEDGQILELEHNEKALCEIARLLNQCIYVFECFEYQLEEAERARLRALDMAHIAAAGRCCEICANIGCRDKGYATACTAFRLKQEGERV